MKIIGCGNRDRGDDQAGIVVAQRLLALGIAAEIHNGDALELLEEWRSDEDVILVDAVVTGSRCGTLHVWDSGPSGDSLPRATEPQGVSSHGLDIAKAIELGRALGRLPRRLRVYGIEGQRFDQGAEPSPEVLGTIDSLVRQIQAELSER